MRRRTRPANWRAARSAQISMRKQHRELLAAVACNQRLRAQSIRAFGAQMRQFAQAFIAMQMPECIIEPFERIDIDQQQGE
jgi:hypothetical protein